MEEKQMKI